MSFLRNRPVALGALLATFGIGLGAGATTYAVVSDDPGVVREVTVSDAETTAAAAGLDIGAVYDRTYRGVVEITVAGEGDPFGGAQNAQGSGFVLDRRGHVVTNHHVVAGGGTVTVTLWNGKRYRATRVGEDPSTDLAVLRIDAPASRLVPLQLASSSAVDVGDPVVAIGSPFGLDGTVTSGIVSALDRQMTAPNDFAITDSIQTDAAINHGNSGGPLLDARGRVIGVNTQIESESGGNDGIGFAVPSNTVRSITRQLVDRGEVQHAYLGIQMAPVPNGAAITRVRAGTPAQEAGLRAATGSRIENGQEIPTGGDVIVAFEGEAVESPAELQAAVDSRRPGDRVTLTILRDGERQTVRVTLATRPS